MPEARGCGPNPAASARGEGPTVPSKFPSKTPNRAIRMLIAKLGIQTSDVANWITGAVRGTILGCWTQTAEPETRRGRRTWKSIPKIRTSWSV